MNAALHGRARFALGRIVATPAALALLHRTHSSALAYVMRHASGDFGALSEEDREANETAIREGLRVLSAYEVGGERLWIITEADRSATTLLLPSDY